MGSGEFRVDPAVLSSAAGQFDAAGSDLSSVLSTLLGALTGTGGMAGNDKPGSQFADFYDKQSHAIEDLLRTAATGLGSIGEGLRATSGNYSGGDGASVNPVSGHSVPK